MDVLNFTKEFGARDDIADEDGVTAAAIAETVKASATVNTPVKDNSTPQATKTQPTTQPTKVETKKVLYVFKILELLKLTIHFIDFVSNYLLSNFLSLIPTLLRRLLQLKLEMKEYFQLTNQAKKINQRKEVNLQIRKVLKLDF